MVPKVCTALEQQNYGFSKSQRGDLLSVFNRFSPRFHEIQEIPGPKGSAILTLLLVGHIICAI